jgi:hypothetical protein
MLLLHLKHLLLPTFPLQHTYSSSVLTLKNEIKASFFPLISPFISKGRKKGGRRKKERLLKYMTDKGNSLILEKETR